MLILPVVPLVEVPVSKVMEPELLAAPVPLALPVRILIGLDGVEAVAIAGVLIVVPPKP
jgi:hypothetical protein